MSAHIDGVFYINLDKRDDRNAEVLLEFDKVGLAVERFSGIEMKPGIVGCGYSHLAVLKLARERGYKNVLIFEDDFEFLVSKSEFWKQINQFFSSNVDYDVLMLSYNLEKSAPVNDIFFKVLAATTASAYIVNSCFYDELITLYEKNMPLLLATGQHWIYANDQIWKSLQPLRKWYGFCVRIGKQRRSYSDNSLQIMDFGC